MVSRIVNASEQLTFGLKVDRDWRVKEEGETYFVYYQEQKTGCVTETSAVAL